MKPKRNSGQILLIATFIMASILLSAQLYVIEVSKVTTETGSNSNSLNDYLLAIKLGSRHLVIGSLANVTHGGPTDVLGLSLQKWSSLLSQQYQFGRSVLGYSVRDAAPYSSGIWLSWGNDGVGVSSAYVGFTHRISDMGVSLNQSYSMNITTTLQAASTYRIVSGDTKQVNVTISVLNEGTPALAEQITIYYNSSNSWQVADQDNSYSILDYGDGTYRASFVADIPSPTVEVSATAIDQRAIEVRTNTTSTQI